MDKLDIRIIREFLQGGPLLSIWSFKPNLTPPFNVLSKRLGVAESTVRARSKKLSSFVSGWTLQVNPNLLGTRIGVLCFEIPADSPKEEILEGLVLVEDMMIVLSFAGYRVDTFFFYPDDFGLKKKIELIAKLSRCKEYAFSEIPFPKCDTILSKTDLRIIASRQVNAKRPIREIARDVGVSSRTVKRRMTRMAREGAVMGLALLDEEELQGCLYAILNVSYKKPELRAVTENAVLSIVDEHLIFNGHFFEHSQLNLILPGIPMARILLSRVQRLEGVKMARIDFIEKAFKLYDLLGVQVERKIAEMSTGPKTEVKRDNGLSRVERPLVAGHHSLTDYQ